MSAPGSTPGPWRVSRHTTKISIYADRMARPHAKSPHVGGLVASTGVTWDSAQMERAIADAHIIAAAPELYEALDQLARAVAHYRLTHDTMGDGHIDTGRAWDAMRKREREAVDVLARASIESQTHSQPKEATNG